MFEIIKGITIYLTDSFHLHNLAMCPEALGDTLYVSYQTALEKSSATPAASHYGIVYIVTRPLLHLLESSQK